MKENVLKTVAQNNNVSEEQVRADVAEALALASGLDKGQSLDVDAVIALLANKVLKALENS
jgi:hypothetical protein